jgi:hypothetical protein
VPLTSRDTLWTPSDWWSTDEPLEAATQTIGAATLLDRSRKEYKWSQDYTKRVLKAYRQFLELKKVLEDWDANILAPSRAGKLLTCLSLQ